MEYWLEVKNIDLILSRKKILDNFTLSLKTQESTVILGPNGSGKSSIVNLINRSIYPIYKRSSYIKLFGEKKINIWNLRSKIGFVENGIQKRVKPNVKIEEFINGGYDGSIGVVNNKEKLKSREEEITKILSKMNLSMLSNKRFLELSDGEKRRVIIARSIINSPHILILDEPFINLDLKATYELIKLLREIVNNGTTILQVTHRIETIIPEITRFILLKDGKIFADGSSTEVMKDNIISELFDTSLKISNNNNFWQVFPA